MSLRRRPPFVSVLIRVETYRLESPPLDVDATSSNNVRDAPTIVSRPSAKAFSIVVVAVV